jgi:hypothetical protein
MMLAGQQFRGDDFSGFSLDAAWLVVSQQFDDNFSLDYGNGNRKVN